MADVRALLAAERQSRRISHPHLSYTKSGMLICTICDLNVKSEALWEGHLRSANHRKNVQRAQENATKGTKRKIEDVDEVQEERDETDTDTRKKARSRPVGLNKKPTTGDVGQEPAPEQAEPEHVLNESIQQPVPSTAPAADTVDGGSTQAPAVDEDEWASFEREVAPLAAAQPDYASATITAAPVTAEQLKQQSDEDKRHRLETEAEDEKEDEERRLEEEFEVMEEMEERVRKLREKRDALRHAAQASTDPGKGQPSTTAGSLEQETRPDEADEADEDEGADEDDWYA
ncbi:hypothetical protein PV05_11342 [Exophiala xenobiotica]|uniref:Uncharacterized protein n=1 Tax=Exophiala xenobiotica TaxID=348802 RepID=A0A0D2E2H5_9EURO|nr:uncharacterized protein PV05_11342 [Exophiala xenobiotica]KIW49688.1 hypothetical protein PV05_11342 [Exophiala xenobiotica]